MSRPFKLNSGKSIAKKSKTIKHFVCDSADKKKFTFVYKAVKTGLKKQANQGCIYLPTKSKRIVRGKEFVVSASSTFDVDRHIRRNDRCKKRKLSTCSHSSSSGFESSRSCVEESSDVEQAIKSFAKTKTFVEAKVPAKACENVVNSNKDPSKDNASVSPTSEYSSCAYEDSNVPSSAGISPNYQLHNNDLLECDTIEVDDGNIVVSKSVLELNEDSAEEIESEQHLVPDSMESKVIEALDEGDAAESGQSKTGGSSEDLGCDNTKETEHKPVTEQCEDVSCKETKDKAADDKQENAPTTTNQQECKANAQSQNNQIPPNQNSTFVRTNYANEWRYYLQKKQLLDQQMLEHQRQQQYIQVQQSYYRQQQMNQWANYYQQQSAMQQNWNQNGRGQNSDDFRSSARRRSPQRSRMSQRSSCVRSRNPSKDNNRSGRSMCRSRSRDNDRSKSRVVSKSNCESKNKEYYRSNSKETVVSSDYYRSKSRDPKASRARSKSRDVGRNNQRSRMSVKKSSHRSRNSSREKRSRRSISRSVSGDNNKSRRSRSRSKSNKRSGSGDVKQVDNNIRFNIRSELIAANQRSSNSSRGKVLRRSVSRSVSRDNTKSRRSRSRSKVNTKTESRNVKSTDNRVQKRSQSREVFRCRRSRRSLSTEKSKGKRVSRRSKMSRSRSVSRGSEQREKRNSRSASRAQRSESCSSLSSLASQVSKKLTKKKKKKHEKRGKKKSKKKHKADKKKRKSKTSRDNSVDKSDFDESEYTVENNEKKLSSVITMAGQKVSKSSCESGDSVSRDHHKHLLENDLRKKLREKHSKVGEVKGSKSIKERIGSKVVKASKKKEKKCERKISIDR